MTPFSWNSFWYCFGVLPLLAILPNCKPRIAESTTASDHAGAGGDAKCGSAAACSLPTLLTPEQIAEVEAAVREKLGRKAAPEVVDEIAPKIAHYLGFLGIPYTER